MSSSSSTVTASSATRRGPINTPVLPPFPSDPPENRIPVTPALLRAIFASSRTTMEERSISRVAFFRFTGFLLSCLGISLAAARGRGTSGLGLKL